VCFRKYWPNRRFVTLYVAIRIGFMEFVLSYQSVPALFVKYTYKIKINHSKECIAKLFYKIRGHSIFFKNNHYWRYFWLIMSKIVILVLHMNLYVHLSGISMEYIIFLFKQQFLWSYQKNTTNLIVKKHKKYINSVIFIEFCYY